MYERKRKSSSSASYRPYKKYTSKSKYTTKTKKSTKTYKSYKKRKYPHTVYKASSSKANELISTDRTRVQLKYTEDKVFFADSGFNYNVYAGNDCYSPNLSRTFGTQPTGFDQWAALYNKYCVLGSKITVSMVNTQDDNSLLNNPVQVAVFPYYNSGDYTSHDIGNPTFETVLAQKYVKTAVLGGMKSNTQPVVLNHYMSTPKMTGKKKILTEEDFNGLTLPSFSGAGDPPKVWFWGIAAYCPGSGLTNASVSYVVEIVYYTMLSGRKLQGPS